MSAYSQVMEAVKASGFVVTEVVSGMAAGPDQAAVEWARKHQIPVKEYPVDKAAWRANPKRAGHERNEVMAVNADALIAIWDGRSRGTLDMIERARSKGLRVYVHPRSTM